MNFSKGTIFKWSLIFLIILTCITDIVSFFTSGLYEFEINPIVLLLKGSIGFTWAIAIAVFFKSLIIIYIAIIIAIYKVKDNKSHVWAYLMVYLGIFCILIQAFGTYSNIHTTIEYNNDPVNTQPLPMEQSTKLLNIANIIFYAMTVVSLFSFWVYENIYRLESNSTTRINRRNSTSPRRA